jgi:hypothetical protein
VHELNGGGERLAWVSEDQRENFQAMWSVQHVLVNCTHLENDNMNAIITVLTSCACPLYDSLTGERFAFGGL